MGEVEGPWGPVSCASAGLKVLSLKHSRYHSSLAQAIFTSHQNDFAPQTPSLTPLYSQNV